MCEVVKASVGKLQADCVLLTVDAKYPANFQFVLFIGQFDSELSGTVPRTTLIATTMKRHS